MSINIVACGIFEAEWNAVKEELAEEFGEIVTTQLEPILHVDLNLIRSEIVGQLERLKEENPVLLYGNMCHPNLCSLASEYHACISQTACHCVDWFLSKEKQAAYAKGEKIFFFTPGFVKNWFDIMGAYGWDKVDIRMNFGFYDGMVLLDTGVMEITDEMLIEIFESTDVPIEVEPITLDYFKENMREMLHSALAHKVPVLEKQER